MTTTFDGSFNSQFTLSNGNETALQASSGGWETILSIGSFASGKKYFEMELVQAHNTGTNEYDSWGFGVANSTTSAHDFPGDSDAHGVCCDTGNANNDFHYNGTKSTGYGGACYRPGDRAACFVDIDNGKVWFRNITRDGSGTHWWGANDTGSDDPTSPSTGFPIATLCGSPVFIAFTAAGAYGGSNNPEANLYTKASDFQGSIPSGGSAWDATTAQQPIAMSVVNG